VAVLSAATQYPRRSHQNFGSESGRPHACRPTKASESQNRISEIYGKRAGNKLEISRPFAPSRKRGSAELGQQAYCLLAGVGRFIHPAIARCVEFSISRKFSTEPRRHSKSIFRSAVPQKSGRVSFGAPRLTRWLRQGRAAPPIALKIAVLCCQR
jgi:hypothetical protein